MKVSNDKYELPEAVADSADELAKMCNVSKCTIYETMSRAKAGKLKKSRYVKVVIEDA